MHTPHKHMSKWKVSRKERVEVLDKKTQKREGESKCSLGMDVIATLLSLLLEKFIGTCFGFGEDW
jgi:hypothetical protein